MKMQQTNHDMKFTLRAARLLNGLTQKQAAHALGISINTLSCYEHSLTYPDVPMLKRLEKLYGVPYENMRFPDLM